MIVDRRSRSLPWSHYGGKMSGNYHAPPVNKLKFTQVGAVEIPERVVLSDAIEQIRCEQPNIRLLDGKILSRLVISNVFTRTPAWGTRIHHYGYIVFAGVLVEFKLFGKGCCGYPAVGIEDDGNIGLAVLRPDERLAHPSQFAVLLE